jgi:hypothetical protein
MVGILGQLNIALIHIVLLLVFLPHQVTNILCATISTFNIPLVLLTVSFDVHIEVTSVISTLGLDHKNMLLLFFSIIHLPL